MKGKLVMTRRQVSANKEKSTQYTHLPGVHRTFRPEQKKKEENRKKKKKKKKH